MKAIITGDIINSRKVDPTIWMSELKNALNKHGKEPKDWEIYRGDSFQIKTTPEFALDLALIIKASIKKYKKLDVRMAIGIGEIKYNSKKISESNGSAFVNSGECFEKLKKNTLAIKTPWVDFDHTINTMLSLVALSADNWKAITAEIIKTVLEDQSKNQQQLAAELNKKSQSTISAGLKRSGFEEIKKVIDFYKSEIAKLC